MKLTFAPLAAWARFGMNLSIYGLGNRHQRSWLAVDLGVSFGDEGASAGYRSDHARYPLSRKGAQESHRPRAGPMPTKTIFGAIVDLWPKLKCPIYATKFSAALFEAKCASERNPPKISGHGGAGRAGASISGRSVSSSSGGAFDSGIARARDPYLCRHRAAYRRLEDRSDAIIGVPTDERRLRELGDCRRAGAGRRFHQRRAEGRSPSEAEVAKTIIELVKAARGRVAVTTFASNVARLRAVADAAKAAGARGRGGRPRHGARGAGARETGYLNGVQVSGGGRPLRPFSA